MEKDFKVIMSYISEVGFGNCKVLKSVEETVLSNGVDYAIRQGVLSESDIDELLDRFDHGDYGSYYDLGDPVIPGKEKGEYDVGFDEEDAVIRINRLGPGRRYCYFRYES